MNVLQQAQRAAKEALMANEAKIQRDAFLGFVATEAKVDLDTITPEVKGLLETLTQQVIEASNQGVTFGYKLLEHTARSTDKSKRGYLMPFINKPDNTQVMLPGYDVHWNTSDLNEKGVLKRIYITRNDEVSGFHRAKAYFAYKNGDPTAMENRAKRELGGGFWDDKNNLPIANEALTTINDKGEVDDRRVKVLESKISGLIGYVEKHLVPEQPNNYEGAAIAVSSNHPKIASMRTQFGVLGMRNLPRPDALVDRSSLLNPDETVQQTVVTEAEVEDALPL